MNLTDILAGYFDKEQNTFSNLFVQMFVNTDNSFAFSDFNRVHEATFTHKQITAGIQELSGSKFVKYAIPEFPVTLWNEFIDAYEFGVYKVAKDWNLYLHEMYGMVLPRSQMLGWIAKQRPARSTGSFLPTSDRNLYAKEERVSSEPRSSEGH